jgi:hypothetical protein
MRILNLSLATVPFVGLIVAALVNCGSDGSVEIVDGPPDAQVSGDARAQDAIALGQTDGGPMGASCKSIAATCSTGAECCVGVCTGGACGGSNPSAVGSKVCSMAGGACAAGFDCCSGTCNQGMCAGNQLVSGGTPGMTGGGGACSGPTTTCTTGSQCCSGRCEPVTGQAGVILCRDACRAKRRRLQRRAGLLFARLFWGRVCRETLRASGRQLPRE